MNRRRGRGSAAFLAALVLSFALSWAGQAWAERSVFFVAADETVLPLSDSDMPFWQDGFLYVSCAIFSDSVAGGAARRNLDISMAQNSDQDRVTLFRGKDSLEFEMGVPFAVDQDGEIRYPGAVWRNGRVFVSAHLAADYFGLLYSVIAVEHGNLVWIRHPSFRLREQAFADAASWQLNNSYQEYINAKPPSAPSEAAAVPSGAETRAEAPSRPNGEPRTEASSRPDPETRALVTPRADVEQGGEGPARPDAAAETAERPEAAPRVDTAENGPPESAPDRRETVPSETQETPETPETQETQETPREEQPEALPEGTPEPETEIRGGADLFLCFRAGENTSALLDTLDGAGVRAAFFCDRAFLEQEGDLVRRMAAAGHSVGLYLAPPEAAPDGPASVTPDSLEAAAENCQYALERCVCLRTRLAFLEAGTGGDALRALGFVCLEPSLRPAALRTASQRGRLLREAEAGSGRASVWLGDSPEELGNLLDDVQAAGDRCLPLTESSFL